MMIKEINDKLNYSLGLEDRLKLLQEIETKYGAELEKKYFYYKTSNLKKYENRKAYDQICGLYDKMSEYILFSPDLPKETEYTYTQESNANSLGSSDDISLDKYMYMLASKDEESECGKKHYDDQNHAEYKIEDFKKDVDRFPEIAEYLKYGEIVLEIINRFEAKKEQYERIKNKLLENGNKKRLKSVNKYWNKYISANHDYAGHCFKNGFTYAKYIKALKNGVGYKGKTLMGLNQDIITVYKELAGLIYFKNPLKSFEKSTRTCDMIDFFNPEDVKAVFRGMCLKGVSDNFDTILHKITKIISKLSLTDNEKEVVEIYKRGRGIEIDFDEEIQKRPERRKDFTINIMTASYCAELMNTVPQNIDRIVNKLSKDISDYYVEWYENNVYYMDLVCGKYKTCSKCGKIKIANENYFSKDSSRKDGLFIYCKKCDTGRK